MKGSAAAFLLVLAGCGDDATPASDVPVEHDGATQDTAADTMVVDATIPVDSADASGDATASDDTTANDDTAPPDTTAPDDTMVVDATIPTDVADTTEPADTAVPQDTGEPADTAVPQDTSTPSDTSTPTDTSTPSGPGTALRFFGNGTGDVDRVKIQIDNPLSDLPGPPADIGASDFTIEFWIRGRTADNEAPTRACGSGVAWIYGNIVVDRDRYNQGRKFGISLLGGHLAFGVSSATSDFTLCGDTDALDDHWHHVAAQRRSSDGRLELYVDGALDTSSDGPIGDISYPDDGVPANACGGPCTESDPFLVLGAEKHDAGPEYPSFDGLIDELRLSSVRRYPAAFTRPSAPFAADADTAALYHFDEGSGDVVGDSANGHASPGVRRFGGRPPGPIWVDDTPFTPAPAGVGAILPSHRALRVLVVSDGVNPNNLTHEQLTEPGDLSAALADPLSGIHLDDHAGAVSEVSSQCIDSALTILGRTPGASDGADVLVYFAHRDARTCVGADVQPDYAAAVDAFLAAGGGVVVFHHGIYQWENKQAILQRLGGHADQYDWELDGQRVIAVAPAHFVAANALAYPDDVAFADAAHGIAAGTYPSFTNAPDERYPSFTLDPQGGAQTVLFATDYAVGGRVLGYALTRAEWSGKVVVYQPGEYQPNSLDLHGPNFQILANAIVWSSNALR